MIYVIPAVNRLSLFWRAAAGLAVTLGVLASGCDSPQPLIASGKPEQQSTIGNIRVLNSME